MFKKESKVSGLCSNVSYFARVTSEMFDSHAKITSFEGFWTWAAAEAGGESKGYKLRPSDRAYENMYI